MRIGTISPKNGRKEIKYCYNLRSRVKKKIET